MANICLTTISFKGEPDNLRRLFSIIGSDDCIIDANKVLPLADGQRPLDLWGCRHDMNGDSLDSIAGFQDGIPDNSGEISLYIDSAWSPHMGVYREISSIIEREDLSLSISGHVIETGCGLFLKLSNEDGFTVDEVNPYDELMVLSSSDKPIDLSKGSENRLLVINKHNNTYEMRLDGLPSPASEVFSDPELIDESISELCEILAKEYGVIISGSMYYDGFDNAEWALSAVPGNEYEFNTKEALEELNSKKVKTAALGIILENSEAIDEDHLSSLSL